MRHRFRISIIMFQFTLPRGERLNAKSICLELPSFNSRSRGGSDGQTLT